MISSRQWMWILFFASLVVYLPGIWWGLPEGVAPDRARPWGTDELGPLGAVNEVYGVFFANRPQFNPQYPLFHYLCQLVFVAPYYAALWITGHISYPAPNYPYGLDNPPVELGVLTLLARSASLVAAAGVVAVAFRTGEILLGRTAGILTALLVGLLYPMFYYARTSNVDTGALLWMALGLLLFARTLTKGLTTRSGIALGVFAALSVATKDAGYGAFLPVGLIVLVRHLQTMRQSGAGWMAALRAPGSALLAALVVYAVSSGLVFRPDRYLRHLRFITTHDGDVGPFYERYSVTIAGYFGFGRELAQYLADAMGWPMLVASLAGIALWAARDRRMLLWLIPAIGIVVGVLAPVRFVQLRYVLPISYLLALPAADLLARGLASPSLVRRAAWTAIVGIVLWSGLRGADLTYQMLNDSRYTAAAWLREVARPGDQIGHFVNASNLPSLPDGVRNVLLRNAHVPAASESGRPELIVSMPLTDIEPVHERILPEETFQRLMDGNLGYRQAALFQGPTLFEHRPATYLNPPVRFFIREDLWASRMANR